MNCLRKVIVTLLVVCLSIAILPTVSFAAQPFPYDLRNSAPPSGATTLSSSDYVYQELEDGTLEIYSYNGNEEEVKIPSKFDGKTVSSIGEHAFWHSDTITSLSVPSSVKKIKAYALGDCKNVEKITISSGATEIDQWMPETDGNQDQFIKHSVL